MMRKTIRLTESDIRRIVKRIIVERLGVPINISETAEQIFNQIYNELIRDTESNEFGESPESIQIFGNYKVGDYEFDEIRVDIIPDKRYRNNSDPQIISFQVSSEVGN